MSDEGQNPTNGGGPPQRRGRVYDRDWTQGSIVKNLGQLAWPIVITQILTQLEMILDILWVARLGASKVAGVGVATTLVMLLAMLRMGLAISQRAMIARLIGSGDIEGANRVASQAFLVNIIYGTVIILGGVILAEPLMSIMGVEAEVAEAGASYLRIAMVGQAALSFRMMGDAAMQASGDTIAPMKISIIMRAFGLTMSPLLIFGIGFFPRLEVTGAALASAMAHIVGAVGSMWILLSGRTRIRLHITFKPVKNIIWEMIKIGTPAAVNSAERSLARILVMRIVTAFGTYGVAAFTIASRVDMLTEIISQGLAQAGGILVGQNLGAGRPDRSYKSAWAAMGIGALSAIVIVSIIFTQAGAIVSFFNPDPELIKVTVPYVRILAGGFLFLCGALVFSQALNGAGDTIPVMIVSITTLWGIELPLAYFLPEITGWGIYGVATAHVTALVLRTCLYVSYFQMGRWKKKKIQVK